MIDIRKGTKEDKADIIDFINCVFSQDKFPHDFKTMVPKCYSDKKDGLGAEHYLILNDGKIKALVANRIVQMNMCAKALKAGLIGNVAVHYYSRGEGYMKKLMNVAIDDAKDMGLDMLVLNGFRQRYGYFGFENAGYKLMFTVNATNIRHTMSEVDISNISFKDLTDEMSDELTFAHELMKTRVAYITREKNEFIDVCRSWFQKPRIIYSGDCPIGYLVSIDNTYSEIVLTDEGDFPRVLKALFKKDNVQETVMSIPPYETRRVEFLASICENYKIEHVEMVSVLNWQKVLETLLILKSEAEMLEDGEAAITVDGKSYSIKVKSGVPTVSELEEAPKGAIALSHNEAERLFFAPIAFLRKTPELKNWAPLPFFINAADAF